jgi:hypothetical protein
MSEPNPHESDLVLGGQNPPPVDAAILGGLAGVKQRLESESIAERLQALNNAVAYGDDGIDLALRSLNDEAIEVQKLAEKLLRYHFGSTGEKALSENISSFKIDRYYHPMRALNQIRYNHKYGITGQEDTTYIVDVKKTAANIFCVKNIDSIVKEPQIDRLRSVIFEFDSLLHKGIHSAHAIEQALQPILKMNAAPKLQSLGIRYKFDRDARTLDKQVIEQEINELLNLIMKNPIIQHLKYLALDLVVSDYGEYFGKGHIV